MTQIERKLARIAKDTTQNTLKRAEALLILRRIKVNKLKLNAKLN